jgi:hypothetical protein
VLIAALLLTCAGAFQAEKKVESGPWPPAEDGLHLSFLPGLRVGGWWMAQFKTTTPAGERKIDPTLFFDAGVDLRLEYGGWSLAATGDYGVANDVTIAAGGVLLGKCWQLGDSPHYLQLSAGPIFGRLDVSPSGFGDFESGVGVEARLSTTVAVHDHIELQIWADYRHLKFDYEEPVVSGDKDAGGATFAVGAGFLMRF